MAAPPYRSVVSPDAVTVRRAVPLADGAAVLALIDAEFSGVTQRSVGLIGLAEVVPDAVPDEAILGELTSLPNPLVAFAALASPTLAARVGAELIGQPQTVAHALPSDVGTARCAVGGRWLLELARWDDPGAPDELVRLAPATAQLGRPSGRRVFTDGVSMVSRELGAPISGLEWAMASLAELVERRCRPDELAVDPGVLAGALGRALGEFHGAMATGSGAQPLDVPSFVERHLADLRTHSLDEVFVRRVQRSLERLTHAEDLGGQIEIHGSLGLTDAVAASGEWAFLGGDPASHVDAPLSDVASLIAAIHEVASDAGGVEPTDELTLLCDAWGERVVERLVAGYVSVPTAASLLPVDRDARDALLAVLELCAKCVNAGRRTGVLSFPQWSS